MSGQEEKKKEARKNEQKNTHTQNRIGKKTQNAIICRAHNIKHRKRPAKSVR